MPTSSTAKHICSSQFLVKNRLWHWNSDAESHRLKGHTYAGPWP